MLISNAPSAFPPWPYPTRPSPAFSPAPGALPHSFAPPCSLTSSPTLVLLLLSIIRSRSAGGDEEDEVSVAAGTEADVDGAAEAEASLVVTTTGGVGRGDGAVVPLEGTTGGTMVGPRGDDGGAATAAVAARGTADVPDAGQGSVVRSGTGLSVLNTISTTAPLPDAPPSHRLRSLSSPPNAAISRRTMTRPRPGWCGPATSGRLNFSNCSALKPEPVSVTLSEM